MWETKPEYDRLKAFEFFMARVIFINRFFHPDHSATSQLVSDLASHLAQAGREVHVITSRQIYDNPKASLPVTEIVQGVHVHRVCAYDAPGGALLLAIGAVVCLAAYRIMLSIGQLPDEQRVLN